MDYTEKIIGAAIEVHKQLGPGLLESIYEKCLAHELKLAGLTCKSQVNIPLEYKGLELADAHRIDLIVENSNIIEIKTVEKLLPVHEAQLLTYMKLSGLRIGLLLNFNVALLKNGIKRYVL